MGTLRALTIEPQGCVFNGVILGDPVELDDDPATFEWDDARFPNGEIDSEGNIIVDEVGL